MSSDDNDKSTEQVLDYYKKYSQNRNLPKYFSGTSLSYLPPIVAHDDDSTCANKSIVSASRALTISEIKVTVHEAHIGEGSSSTSSSASASDHRKLEWDNGADIGYSPVVKSCKKLQKSSSLPILDDTKTNADVPTLVPSTIITHSTSDEKIGVLLFSSSSSSQDLSKSSARQSSKTSSQLTLAQKFHPTSTETSTSYKSETGSCIHADSDDAKFGDFQKTIDFLKQKIGLPGAHSTPYIEETRSDNKKSKAGLMATKSSETALSPEESKKASFEKGSHEMKLASDDSHPEDNEFSSRKNCKKSNTTQFKTPDKIHRNVQTKIVELSISTPINVNCTGLALSDKTVEIVKTVLPKAVQTESVIQQNIETQFNSEANAVDDEAPSRLLAKQEALSISEDVSGSASSFEYINLNKKSEVENTTTRTRMGTKTSTVSGVLHAISLSNTTTESSNISKTSSEDIDLHLKILQKLLKSKKIQSGAKRKYIQKILKELNQIETSNDSNTSSDLFIPKKGSLKCKVAFKEGGDVMTSCNSGNSHLSSHVNTQPFTGGKTVVQTKTCQPSSYSGSEKMSYEACIKIASTNISKFADETSNVRDDECNCEISSAPNGSADVTQRKPEPLNDVSTKTYKPTMYKAKFGIGSVVNPSKSEKLTTFSAMKDLSSCSCSEENTNNKRLISRDQSNQKWVGPLVTDKSSKISSNDRVLLADAGNTGSTATLSKKYSEDCLIEFAENERTYQLNWINNEISHLSKLKNILELRSTKSTRSKTSTYNVARKQDSGKSSARDYVIQTRLDYSQDQNINYMLDGKEYIVSSDSQKSSNDGANCILADIVVNSDENGTNIKVRTLCSSCKQIVCICCSQKTIQSKLSSILTTCNESLCSVCQQGVCICNQGSINSHHEKVEVSTKPGSFKEGTSSSEKEINQPINLQEDNVSTQSSDVEVVSEDDFNSLQKVFKKCCCTIQNPHCGCDFVKKLLDKFQVSRARVDLLNEAVQSERLEKINYTTASQKNPSAFGTSAGFQTENRSQESRTQTPLLPSQDTEVQVGFSNAKNVALQTGGNLLCRCTQTEHDDIVESTQTRYRQDLREQGLSTSNIKSLKDGIIQSTSNEATRSAQTDPRHNLRDKSSSTSDIAIVRDDVSQALTAEVATKTQTNKKLLRNNAVQVSDDIDHASVQAKKDVTSSAVQTESGVDREVRKDEKSSTSFGRQEAGKESPRTFGQVYDSKPLEAISNSIDVGIQFPSLTKVNPTEEGKALTVDSQASTVGNNGTSSASNTSRASSGSSRIICFCCKQKAFLAEVSFLQEGNDSLAVCSRCYYNRPRYCSHNPRFMCRCWAYFHARQGVNTGQYCSCCRTEVAKCPRRGVMYTVTLEGDNSEKRRYTKNDVKDIKVQDGWTRKSLKNKENYYKKDDDLRNSLRRERRKKKDHDKGKGGMGKDADQIKSKKEGRQADDETNRDSDRLYTLTEYLIKNRPEFICSAEYRRQILLNSRILREQQKEDVKLHFLESNVKSTDKAKYKLFTEREMKEINKKNYKKLPEVRKKQVNQRETRLRSADRLISNVFAKKVQKSVLRGIGNFPIDKPLTNL